MSGLIVITRPEPDASDYAQELRNEGYTVFIEPMLKLEPVAFDVPDLSGFDGLLATSANALRFFIEGGGQIADVPVFCVGKHTEQVAKDLGFKTVFSVDGTGVDLLDYLINFDKADRQKFLHVCGRHVAFPLSRKLIDKGLECETLEVYVSVLVDGFSEEFIDALKSETISAVTFFSKRTSEAFVSNVRKSESESMFSSIKALSISEAVLECVRVLSWKAAHVSDSPDRAGMMKVISTYV